MKYVMILMSLLVFETAQAQEQTEIPPGGRKIYSGAKSLLKDNGESSEKKMTRRQYKKTFRYKFYKHHEDLIDQYYKRMKKNKRKYKRLARKLKKPQYSDPSYFGHKRKPKIRPIGKRKLCKECGIVH